ncbi:MAG: DsbE family thiol:disulfide interchange protein [Burkholderiales bacterium]
MTKFLLPLGVFLVIAVFLGVGLTLNPREVPSPLIDKPAPGFTLAQLHAPEKSVTLEDLRGQVWLLNVWASWCTPCLEEHPYFVELARTGEVPIFGLNYKDRREAALQWLARHGDPYRLTVQDGDGRVGIDYGVYGVPETFVIDAQGIIRYKHVGPVNREVLEERILPLVRELQS